ncbi:sulfotransferase domain-containing protein [Parvicella tangerina]|uniref:Sulfotransferase domain-containing protein n=1 Tax=Parvicella tangerina TaxID=2829795 RepID=A0A916JIZ3_9FLAO|nr:sulfotransferase domain-containing protein [Parvicella tangerina]CAG5076342.1 hypothetical protein CRYO30217_00075 [Parvicella tangerina]
MGVYFNKKRKLKHYFPILKWNFKLFLAYPYYRLTAYWRKDPDFLIIGAMKSGTTFLYHYLDNHPEVNMSRIQEVNYFAKHYYRSKWFYRSFFPFKKENKLTGESGIYYLFHPKVAERVKKFNPNLKLIVLMRNPVDRAYSHYNQIKEIDPADSFDEAIKLESDRAMKHLDLMNQKEHYRSVEFETWSYANRGKYGTQLKRWLDQFPKEQFLFIKSEEMFENPGQTLVNVQEFLGVPNHNYENITPQNQRNYAQEILPETKQFLDDFYKDDKLLLKELIGPKFSWDD